MLHNYYISAGFEMQWTNLYKKYEQLKQHKSKTVQYTQINPGEPWNFVREKGLKSGRNHHFSKVLTSFSLRKRPRMLYYKPKHLEGA